jgi:hypothetical protein
MTTVNTSATDRKYSCSFTNLEKVSGVEVDQPSERSAVANVAAELDAYEAASASSAEELLQGYGTSSFARYIDETDGDVAIESADARQARQPSGSMGGMLGGVGIEDLMSPEYALASSGAHSGTIKTMSRKRNRSSDLSEKIAVVQHSLNRAKTSTEFESVENQLKSILLASERGAYPSSENELMDTVRQRFLLLLCQSNSAIKRDEADLILSGRGFKYRLSTSVLRWWENRRFPPASLEPTGRFSVCVIDDALPCQIFDAIRQTFSTESAYWSEHHYHRKGSGYFSYIEHLDGRTPGKDSMSTEGATPTSTEPNVLVKFLRHIVSLAAMHLPDKISAPNAVRAAEWWAHLKPLHAGNPLHFDSVGGYHDGDSLRTPLVSSVSPSILNLVIVLSASWNPIQVLYLTSGGGPTIVTDQHLDQDERVSDFILLFSEEYIA